MTSDTPTKDAKAASGLKKLYQVPRNSRIKVNGMELNFHHIDGMYSLCSDDHNNYINLAAWTEVEDLGKERFK